MVTFSFVHPAVERRGIDEMEQWRARQQMLSSSMDPALGSRIVEMSQVWPDLPHGALVGLAMVGADPYDDAMAGIDALAAQRSQGLGFHSPGEVVNARQIERELAAEDDSEGFLFRNSKAMVRGAFMGMETAFEEVSRRVTSGLVALQDPNMTYGRAMELSKPSQGALLASEEFGWADLGEGWIPGGDILEEQERLKERLTLDGEWMSPGRAIARTVTEPGTRAFDLGSGLLDFGFRIFGDPATYATAGLSKARLASKGFVADNMLIRGIRRTTDEQFARNWWTGSAVGQRLRQSLVDLDDPYEVWLRLGGAQSKVDRETARLIAEARTTSALDDIVLPRLGPGGIAEKPVGSPLSRGIAQVFGDDVGAIHGLGIHVRRAADRSRMLQWLPDSTLTPNDPDRAMLTLDRFLKGAKFSREERGELMGRAFRIGTGESRDEFTSGWMNLAMDVAEKTAARAISESVSDTARGARRAQQIANRIRVSLRDSHEELTNYFVRESTRPRSGVRTMVGGESIDFEKVPHLVTEYLGNNIPLPDMQYVRRHIGSYARTLRTLEDIWQPLGMSREIFEGTVDFASKIMTRMWKPAVLLRGAYVIRVGGEEQVRMAAAGMSSAFRHPVDYLLYATGRRGHVFNGTSLEDMTEWQAILQRSGGGWLGRRAGSTPTDDWIRFQRGAPGMTDDMFARAYADDLGFLINDETASRVARDGVEATFDYLQTAKGKEIVRQIAQAEHNRAVATDPGALRAYLRSVYERIEEKARGNADIMNAISTGRIDGRVVRGVAADRDGLVRSLRSRLDDVGITEVKGQRIIDPRGRDEITAKLNGVVDILGEWIMSKPTNFGSRSPAWKQSFWRSMERQIGFMDDATQRAVIAQANRAGLSRSAIRRMESARKAGAGGRITSLEDAELIAKGTATADTRKLLYELTEHGQFSDMMRAAIPFAEAWKEIFVAWARILRDNPQVLRRGQQAVQGARGAGWFHTDPTSGEEMFCVDEQTQALTRRGWVSHDDLSESDEVLSLDPHTDTIQWQPVLGVYRFEHDGELTRWTGSIDALTTGNHRWVVEGSRHGSRERPTDRHRDHFAAREFRTTEWLSRQGGRAIVSGGGVPQACAAQPTFSDEFVELIGWVVTEGCYDRRYRGVTISQSERVNPDDVERIRMLVKHYADQGATATEWAQRRDGECTFYFGEGIARLIRDVSPDKALTPQFIGALTHPQAMLLLNTLIRGDGHVRPNGARQWVQKDEGRVAAFQMLCGMLGIRTHAKIYDGRDTFQVWMYRTRRTWTTNATLERHSGLVWCPRTPAGTWFARRNGKTYWTGNSYPGGNLVSRGLMSGHFDSGIGRAVGATPVVGPLAMGAVGAFQDEQPAEFDLVGSVSGLNLFAGSVVPGFGPTVTTPAAVLLPDRPTFDWVRDNVLFPFGEPDVKAGALESVLPAWMQRYRTALMSDPDTDRTYANSVFDIARALMATGEFSTSSPEEVDRLLTTAKQRAKGLFLVRGASQFIAPTGPQARFRVQDLDGDWWPYQVIIQEFGRMRQEHGEEQAVAEFIDSFGTDLITMVQSKSREVVSRPASQVGDDWIRANDDLRRRYPLTVGLIAPDDPTGEFSYEAYRRSFDEGAREQLTPEQMVWLSNNLLGRFAYSHGVSLVGDGQDIETRMSRAALRSKLMERFPGYNSHLGVRERPSADDQIAELEALVGDERVADLEVTGAIREYLEERRRANILVATMAPRSTTFTRSQETAWIRQMLRMRAQEIMRRTPEFTVVFERVFERELADDEQILPGEMGSLATFGLGG